MVRLVNPSITQLPLPDGMTHVRAGESGVPAASSAVTVSKVGAPPVGLGYLMMIIPEPPATDGPPPVPVLAAPTVPAP